MNRSEKGKEMREHRAIKLRDAYKKVCTNQDLFLVISDIWNIAGVFRSPGYERMREADIAEGMRRVGIHIVSQLESAEPGLFADFLKKHSKEDEL